MIYSKIKPKGYVEGIRTNKGNERPCDECGNLTNHYQHDFISCDNYYVMITLCKQCQESQERFEEWQNKHDYEKSTICPWCEYEFEGYEDDYEEVTEEECECPMCGKTFMRSIEVEYSYTTWKPEDEYEVEE